MIDIKEERARGLEMVRVNGVLFEVADYGWECLNMYGAIVHDGLYRNEAELIAKQHGLTARKRP